MKRTSWSTTILFFIAGVVLRLPFRSHFLYHWDSVNFAFGLSNYDILNHQPQPPGYILYILLGRLFKLVFVDDNASLVWMSILFSGLAVAALYWTAAYLFDEPVGVVAGLLMLTSPLVWFYSEVALTYIVEAFFVSLIGYCCYRQLQGDRRFVIPAAVLLGLAGGFRQNTLVFLFPLWFYSLKGVPFTRRVLGIVVLAAVVSGWMAIMVLMSGGWDNFWRAMMSQSGSNLSISAAGSLQYLLLNFVRLGLFTFYGLFLSVILLPVFVIWFPRHFKEVLRDPAWQVLLFWIIPALGFYTAFVQQAGYTFTYLPALFILIAFSVVHIAAPWVQKRMPVQRSITGLTGLLAAANIVFFLFINPYLFGIDKFLLRTPGYQAIKDRDTVLAQKISFIRGRFPADQTLVLAGGMDFRIPDYYLSEYRLPYLSHDLTRLTGEDVQQANTIRYLVVFNNEEMPYPSVPVQQFQVFLPGDPLYWTELGSADHLLLSKNGVELKRNALP